MNAMALKRFVQENQKLAAECANLLTQCNKWERECNKWERECLLYDRDREALMDFGNEAHERAKKAEGTTVEENLLDSVLATLVCKDEVASGRAFLEANTSLESCQRLLKMWNSKAEEKVKVLFEENSILDEANRKLLRQSIEGKNLHDSGGKHTGSASAKTNKRKLNPKICSPIEKKINFADPDSARKPVTFAR
ncbi:putative RNA-binding family protein [Hibiscus syriacus]|uniref:RNA-binding family protein n=1 Tax=Hibiscus syriacus TaxID=106335 RepID=A0A6A3BF71_HIBSY|nr:putative RNA-binding family protein [Hibiscus syriacus]